jgi:glycosyltransferase involved in cell wall biosynthesis
VRIGINARFLLKDKLEGLGRYSHELVSRLVKNHPEHEFYLFFDRKYDAQFIYAQNVKAVVVSPPARHPFLWYLWFEWFLPLALKRNKIDYFISLDTFLSLKTNIPQHLVVHDLAFEHFPEGIPSLVQKFYSHFVPKYTEKAKKIVAVSSFTKKDICQQYKTNPDKIDVILNGVSDDFRPISQEKVAKQKQELTQNNPYFVSLGAMHPRKNLANLLKAFDLFKNTDNQGFKLVLVGRKAWQNEEMEQVYESMNFKNEVIFTGRVSDADLQVILASAQSLVYVPFFEGFGLPIVEAQKTGVPVICSNTSSMPEVVGDAGILVSPSDVNEIKEAMLKMSDSAFRDTLIEKSLANVQRFSWDKAATKFWESVEKELNI